MQAKIDFVNGMRIAKNVDDVNKLLRDGMPLDLKDENGNSLIMIVVKVMIRLHRTDKDYPSIVNHLIALGVDLNVRNREGKTALSLAFECGRLAPAISIITAREKVLVKDTIAIGELEEVEEVVLQNLEEYHAKPTTKVIEILLANNAQFTQQEGVNFHNKFLALDLNNQGVYTCLRMIEKRYVSKTLNAYLSKIDVIFDTMRQPLYLTLQATQFFSDVIIKIIGSYQDPLENNYLMKSDIQKMFSRTQRPSVETITAILKKGLFRAPALQVSNNLPQLQAATAMDVSPDSQMGVKF